MGHCTGDRFQLLPWSTDIAQKRFDRSQNEHPIALLYRVRVWQTDDRSQNEHFFALLYRVRVWQTDDRSQNEHPFALLYGVRVSFCLLIWSTCITNRQYETEK